MIMATDTAIPANVLTQLKVRTGQWKRIVTPNKTISDYGRHASFYLPKIPNFQWQL